MEDQWKEGNYFIRMILSIDDEAIAIMSAASIGQECQRFCPLKYFLMCLT